MDYCLMMELKKKATAARTRNGTYNRNADELEKIFQDAGNALKAEFEEGYSAGYAEMCIRDRLKRVYLTKQWRTRVQNEQMDQCK